MDLAASLPRFAAADKLTGLALVSPVSLVLSCYIFDMGTDFWIRNPSGCIREVIAAGENKIVFDAGYVGKRNIDPAAFLKLHFGAAGTYEYIVIREHGAQHFRSNNLSRTHGVYPVWNAERDSMAFLEEWCANPIGADMGSCNNSTLNREQRPIFGQEHRIVIHGLPSMTTFLGKQALQSLHHLNQDYPDVKFLVHGLYTFVPVINLKLAEFTFEPREAAVHKAIHLPNGRKVLIDAAIHKHAKWISLLGFTVADMSNPKKRCEFNIRSARWATLHTLKPSAFVQSPSTIESRPDPAIPDVDYVPRSGGRMMTLALRAQPGDKVECDTCSLSDSCKYSREGSVCTLPGSEMSELASMFDTTDSSTILRGMAKLTALSAQRVEMGMAFEDDFGLDPDVTRMLRQTFDFAERYAKLNDPMLRASVSFNNNNNNGSGGTKPIEAERVDVMTLTPQQAAAAAIEHYAEKGFKRDQITQEMMREFIREQTRPVAEIPAPGAEVQEAEVVN